MTIEILFSEVAGLYGDAQNAKYLEQCMPEAEFIYTPFTEEPYFVNNTPDMIYIGSMSEQMQRQVIEKFRPYKKRIEELIDGNCIILATGNSGEIFCKKIHFLTEKIETEGLSLFPLEARTDLFDRYNRKLLGEFEGIKIVGFRAQFSFIYGDNSENYFVKVERGDGINKESRLEGMKRNNLICTSVLGPILLLNPLFTEYLMKKLGYEGEIAFKEEAMAAYEKRLAEFEDVKVKF